MLTVENLTLHYGKSQILNGVSMAAQAGAVTCVMGTNGVGKTSLLRAIAGAHPRSGGEVSLDGAQLGRLPAHQLARMGVGYVPQGRDIFPLMSVLENLRTGFSCLPKSEHHVPDEIYDLFPVLKDMRQRRGGDLSGGQQQQLAIARALINDPQIIIADEPTAHLDSKLSADLLEILQSINQQGKTIIIATHDPLVYEHPLMTRTISMRDGRIEGITQK